MAYTVFLDRDGVINADSPLYIKSPAEFHFIPKSPEAIALLCDHGFEIIIITNQSAINRKMFEISTLEAIFEKMITGVEKAGGRIKDIFYCPHTPDENCNCRKPLPGLIDQAIEKYHIDPAFSLMVGDSAKDIECGRAAGCDKTVLVGTGNGKSAEAGLKDKGLFPDLFTPDLFHGAQWIVSNIDPRG